MAHHLFCFLDMGLSNIWYYWQLFLILVAPARRVTLSSHNMTHRHISWDSSFLSTNEICVAQGISYIVTRSTQNIARNLSNNPLTRFFNVIGMCRTDIRTSKLNQMIIGKKHHLTYSKMVQVYSKGGKHLIKR